MPPPRNKCRCGCGALVHGHWKRGHHMKLTPAERQEREEFIDDFPGSAEQVIAAYMLDGPDGGTGALPSSEVYEHFRDELEADGIVFFGTDEDVAELGDHITLKPHGVRADGTLVHSYGPLIGQPVLEPAID